MNREIYCSYQYQGQLEKLLSKIKDNWHYLFYLKLVMDACKNHLTQSAIGFLIWHQVG